MQFKRLAHKNKEAAPESYNQLYSNKVICRIRKKYSLNAELAVLRQRDSKPDEFDAYNEFVELCKKEVKEELDL